MPLVTSLLTAIVRADGDALVLHAGERPYVVAPTGQTELASRTLTLDAMKGMLRELLPADAERTLDEFGAVQHALSSPRFATNESFSVIAARGGDDIWIEIRRHRGKANASASAPPSLIAMADRPDVPIAPVAPIATVFAHSASAFAQSASAFAQSATADKTADKTADETADETPDKPGAPIAPNAPGLSAELEVVPEPELTAPPASEAEPEPEAWNIELTDDSLVLDAATMGVDLVMPEPELQAAASSGIDEIDEVEQEPEDGSQDEIHEISLDVYLPSTADPEPRVEVPAAAQAEAAPSEAAPAEAVPTENAQTEAAPAEAAQAEAAPPPPVSPAPPVEAKRKTGPVEVPPAPVAPPSQEVEIEARPAVVLPLARTHVRSEPPTRFSPPLHASGIDRLLRIAAARGASTLYLTSQARPFIRVDGEISPIDGESVLSETDVEALILDIIPDRNREALRNQADTEWICDVPDVGRIRCVTFRDHRGAGGIFRMIPARAISAEQLGLSREIQGLCAEGEGLVLVAGPKSSGQSTLIAAFVNLINRTRSDHVITLENQIEFVHENRGSLVSQREVRGDRIELLSMARAALRENPDVLVIENFESPEIVTLAIEAAQCGHLVIGALMAHTATEVVDRIIEQSPPERRQKMQQSLAETLRGIVVQTLLRKAGGGRVAAREVLLNTRAVANVIAEGKTSQLPMAIDSGRKYGMVALNDVLVALVQGGIVDSREAYRRASDHQAFLALLKRTGIDTSFVERLA